MGLSVGSSSLALSFSTSPLNCTCVVSSGQAIVDGEQRNTAGWYLGYASENT
jgi:hypothetical protein